MATSGAAGLPVRTGRSPKPRGTSLRHKARSQHDVVQESEQSLHKLLEDFELGHLNAFGEGELCINEIFQVYNVGGSDMLQKVNDIRDMQEKLTVKHFEIDQR